MKNDSPAGAGIRPVPGHVNTATDAREADSGGPSVGGTSDKRYQGNTSSFHVNAAPLVLPERIVGSGFTSATVGAGDSLADDWRPTLREDFGHVELTAADLDAWEPEADSGLPDLDDDAERIRDFWRAYGSGWGRVARLAGKYLARVDPVLTLSPGQWIAYAVASRDADTLARALRAAGGAS